MGQEIVCTVRNILCVSCIVMIRKTQGAQPSLEVEVSLGKEGSLLLEENKEDHYKSHNKSDNNETAEYHNLDLLTIAEQILFKDDIFNYSQNLNKEHQHDHHGHARNLNEHDHDEHDHDEHDHDDHNTSDYEIGLTSWLESLLSSDSDNFEQNKDHDHGVKTSRHDHSQHDSSSKDHSDHDHSGHDPPLSLTTWLVSLSSIAFISLVGLATVAAVPLLQGR